MSDGEFDCEHGYMRDLNCPICEVEFLRREIARLREENTDLLNTVISYQKGTVEKLEEIERLREAICEWEIAEATNKEHDPNRWRRLHKAETVLREIAREGK